MATEAKREFTALQPVDVIPNPDFVKFLKDVSSILIEYFTFELRQFLSLSDRHSSHITAETLQFILFFISTSGT